MLRQTRLITNSQTEAAPIPKELSKGVLDEYRVEPGDTLLVEVDSLEDSVRLPGDQVVRPDGKISIGSKGDLKVAGMTIEEIKAAVSKAMESESEQNGTVTVRLINWESKVFYVIGEVNSPGAYPIQGNETVLDAIVAAGDLSRNANKQKIILARPTLPDECRIVLPVCYRHIVQLGDTSTNYQIQPGDRIYVPSLGVFDDIAQTIFPRRQEDCPRCSSCQFGCDSNGVTTELSTIR